MRKIIVFAVVIVIATLIVAGVLLINRDTGDEISYKAGMDAVARQRREREKEFVLQNRQRVADREDQRAQIKNARALADRTPAVQPITVNVPAPVVTVVQQPAQSQSSATTDESARIRERAEGYAARELARRALEAEDRNRQDDPSAASSDGQRPTRGRNGPDFVVETRRSKTDRVLGVVEAVLSNPGIVGRNNRHDDRRRGRNGRRYYGNPVLERVDEVSNLVKSVGRRSPF